MATIRTDLGNTREAAKRIRYSMSADNPNTNVQDAIDQAVALSAGGAVSSIGVASSPYTVPPGTEAVLVDTTGGAVTINVGLASARTIKALTIKDDTANAATNNITVNRTGADTFDGATSIVMRTNSAAITLRKKTGGYYRT